MKKLTFLLFLVISANVFSQNATITRADKYFEKTYYSKAIPLYLEALSKGRNNHILKRLGDAYYFTIQMKEAATYYKMLLDGSPEDIDSDYYFKYAQTLKVSENTEEADMWMLKYIESKKGSSVGDYKEELLVLEEVKALGQRFEMKNLALNTPLSDFGAYPFGNSIVFATPRKKAGFLARNFKWNDQPYLDLYVVEATEQLVKDTITSGFSEKLNTKDHESNAVFTKDGKTVYFTRNSGTTDDDKISHLQIYRADYIDDEWTNIQSLPFNSNEYSIEHPALSPDGRYLFFSSDMPGSFGSFDIYAVPINKDGTYGKPQNVGPNINTEKREQFPFISESNLLYFSSDGHAGLGLLDVFVSMVEDGLYQKPVNVGLPVNSPYDDFSFYMDEYSQTGYIASNRPGGKGDDDIYTIKEIVELKLIPPSQVITGDIKESDTDKPLANASLTAKDKDGNTVTRGTTDKNGIYRLNIEGDNTYSLYVEKPNYIPAEKTITLDDKRNKVNTENFKLTSVATLDDDLVRVDDKLLIKVENIYFNFDKWNIRSDAKIILDGVVAKMNEYPKMTIEIGSHTDKRGAQEYNMYLSDKRAQSTRDYIISQGIDGSRITAKGYGKSQPVVNCNDRECTKEEHELNRRSEFVIINTN